VTPRRRAQPAEDFDVVASRAVRPLFYEAPVPPELPNGMKPMPFQHAGVEYRIARRHGLIGDPPGLTKTAQAVMTSNALGSKSNLAIVPASLRLNWAREIWAWSTKENVTTYPVLKSKDGVSLKHDWVIISYDLLRNDAIFAALMEHRWDHLICDEAHALKDPAGNRRTQRICAPDALPSVVGNITLLSGTIMPNQPKECLGEATLVLTDGGWKPIVDVTENDLLWDGVEWVRHEGLEFRGVKPVINLAGVDMTPDHILLSGAEWRPAEYLARHENILRLALETGMDSLPSSASCMALAAASLARRLSGAPAAATLSPSTPATCAAGAQPGAAHAARKPGSPGTTGTTRQPAPTENEGVISSIVSRIVYSGAGPLAACPTTAAGGYECIPPGFGAGTDAAPSSAISSHSPAGITRLWNWIASTLIAGMNPAIFAGPRTPRTCRTSAASASCRGGSTPSKPVYDIVNAGPRHRFTILTERGPLIVHNCYNAIRLLNWEAINKASLDDFTETYYAKGGGWVRKKVKVETKNGQEATAYKLVYDTEVRNVPTNLADLQYRLRKHLMVRRDKAEVMPWLPKLRWHPIPLMPTAEIRRAMKHPGWYAAEKLYDLDENAFDHGIPVDGAVSTARLELGLAKAPGVADYIEDMLESGIDKIVVAAWHHETLKYYRERLEKHGLVFMDGSTSPARKQSAVDQFQSNPKVKVILGQAIPLGMGWTLTAAQDVVDAEPDWVPGNNQQIGDRIARPGQIGDRCTLHIPVVPGTLDEKIIGTNIRKAMNIHEAMDARAA
jgi:hypothetical protein